MADSCGNWYVGRADIVLRYFIRAFYLAVMKMRLELLVLVIR